MPLHSDDAADRTRPSSIRGRAPQCRAHASEPAGPVVLVGEIKG